MAANQVIERLREAVDAHNLDALVTCFAADFRNETPAHPGRGFAGQEQVRSNWARIFGGVPDITARVVRTAVDGDVIWTEWELGGTRVDGVPQQLRGVIIWGVSGDRLVWSRFYLEPVDAGEDGVESAIGRIAGAHR